MTFRALGCDGFEYDYSRKSSVARRQHDRFELTRAQRLSDVKAAVSSRRLPKLPNSRSSSKSTTATSTPQQSGDTSPSVEHTAMAKLSARSSSTGSRHLETTDLPPRRRIVKCVPFAPHVTGSGARGAPRNQLILPPLATQHSVNVVKTNSKDNVSQECVSSSVKVQAEEEQANLNTVVDLQPLDSAITINSWLEEANHRVASLFPPKPNVEKTVECEPNHASRQMVSSAAEAISSAQTCNLSSAEEVDPLVGSRPVSCNASPRTGAVDHQICIYEKFEEGLFASADTENSVSAPLVASREDFNHSEQNLIVSPRRVAPEEHVFTSGVVKSTLELSETDMCAEAQIAAEDDIQPDLAPSDSAIFLQEPERIRGDDMVVKRLEERIAGENTLEFSKTYSSPCAKNDMDQVQPESDPSGIAGVGKEQESSLRGDLVVSAVADLVAESGAVVYDGLVSTLEVEDKDNGLETGLGGHVNSESTPLPVAECPKAVESSYTEELERDASASDIEGCNVRTVRPDGCRTLRIPLQPTDVHVPSAILAPDGDEEHEENYYEEDYEEDYDDDFEED